MSSVDALCMRHRSLGAQCKAGTREWGPHGEWGHCHHQGSLAHELGGSSAAPKVRKAPGNGSAEP